MHTDGYRLRFRKPSNNPNNTPGASQGYTSDAFLHASLASPRPPLACSLSRSPVTSAHAPRSLACGSSLPVRANSAVLSLQTPHTHPHSTHIAPTSIDAQCIGSMRLASCESNGFPPHALSHIPPISLPSPPLHAHAHVACVAPAHPMLTSRRPLSCRDDSLESRAHASSRG